MEIVSVGNLPQPCLHPVGHWFGVSNLLRHRGAACMDAPCDWTRDDRRANRKNAALLFRTEGHTWPSTSPNGCVCVNWYVPGCRLRKRSAPWVSVAAVFLTALPRSFAPVRVIATPAIGDAAGCLIPSLLASTCAEPASEAAADGR